MNKQAKEDYENLWNDFVDELPSLTKNGSVSSAKAYTKKLKKLFEDIFVTDGIIDKDGMMPDDDKVNHPTHYQSYNPKVSIECIDAMRAAFGDDNVKTFCLINSFKYIYRSSSKGQNTDIKKAQWYLSKFLELGGYE